MFATSATLIFGALCVYYLSKSDKRSFLQVRISEQKIHRVNNSIPRTIRRIQKRGCIDKTVSFTANSCNLYTERNN